MDASSIRAELACHADASRLPPDGGMSPLLAAAARGDAEALTAVLLYSERAPDLEVRAPGSEMTALCLAAQAGSEACVRALLVTRD